MLFLIEEHELTQGTNDRAVFHAHVESIGPRTAFTEADRLKRATRGDGFLYSSTELEEVESDFLWRACDGSDNYVEVRKVR